MRLDRVEIPTREQRRADRSPTLLAAVLRSSRGESSASILNVSAAGAKIDADVPPRKGESVVLVRGDFLVAGKIVWVDGHRLGVDFLVPISAEEVRQLASRRPPRAVHSR